MKRLITFLLLALTTCVSATTWSTHFAYNNVSKIAAGGGKVYAVSSGSLFSIDAMNEHITTYSTQDGMHGHSIACIHWLESTQSLMIVYSDGRVDMLCNGQFRYIPDLYNKFTTLVKQCHSVTEKDSLVYMAMEYGIQTFHITKQDFRDTYFIGPNATEVSVNSIAFAHNRIYAAADSILYSASLADNIIDYSFWSTVDLPKQGAIQGIAQAGGVLYMLMDQKCYKLTDSGWQVIDDKKYTVLNVIDDTIYPSDNPTLSYEGLWIAAGSNGLIRQMNTGEQITYRLDGPSNNNPYRLTFQQGQLFMVNGGRWASQNNTPGRVMRYAGGKWHNISQKAITNAVGTPCYDIMNVAVDPTNPAHFFASSYGTGLYEFMNDTCIMRWNTENSILGSAAKSNPQRYTRTDGVMYDHQNNVWVMNGGDVPYNIVVFTADGQQVGMNVMDEQGDRVVTHTVGQLLIDNRNPNHIWVLIPRNGADVYGVGLIDTKGTITNTDDDRTILRSVLIDDLGNEVARSGMYAMRQDKDSNIWIATSHGIVIIPAENDFFESPSCKILRVYGDNGIQLFTEEAINDIVFDEQDRAWLASQNSGVYVLSHDWDQVLLHFTTDNSALPSNSILSLAYDRSTRRMYIGSSLGLVSCIDHTTDVNQSDDNSYTFQPDFGSMEQWTTHFAYTNIDVIQLSSSHAYALSEGSLCSIHKDDESLTYYSKLNGLNGSSIQRIDYDTQTRRLMIIYDDGMIDLMDDNEVAHPVADLYLKQMQASKQVQDVTFHDGKAYLAMTFGIMVVNIRKEEISDTYYIGKNGSAMLVNTVAICGDSIYAASGSSLYTAHMNDNLVDYMQWNTRELNGTINQLLGHNSDLYMIMGDTLYHNFSQLAPGTSFTSLTTYKNSLLARTSSGEYYKLDGDQASYIKSVSNRKPRCAIGDDDKSYWLGTTGGIIHQFADGSTQNYEPNGPSTNMPYSLTTYGTQVWGVPGGRWASDFNRLGRIMYYTGSEWNNISTAQIRNRLNDKSAALYDFCHVAVDPADPAHYYVASYGTGLLEFMPDGTAKQYTAVNSPICSAVPKQPLRYSRVDALTFDPEGNLWITNSGEVATNMHVINPQHEWYSFNLYSNGSRITLNATSKMIVDNRNSNYKWIACARSNGGLILFNDNGTPYNSYDDRSMFRAAFLDQDQKSVSIDRLYSIAQNPNGDLWVGTNTGIFVIEAATDFMRSNACWRPKIARHDGTNLADYLLGTEQINAIVFASSNRMWVGTEASGVYLIRMVNNEGIYEPEILAHFTTVNSPMPSDCVMSIAIDERGEVYIGTDKGLVSYRGDATQPQESFNNIYAYPNPVRPNFEGTITISGLMDNTVVYIADAAGNVVCRTHSNGGTAIWDGKTQAGKKVHSGVYTVYCNTPDGQNHATTKILIMH